MKTTYLKTTGATILLQIDQAATNAAVQAAMAKLDPLPKLTPPTADAGDEAKAKYQAALAEQMQSQAKREAEVRAQVGSIYYPNDAVTDIPPPKFDASADDMSFDGKAWTHRKGDRAKRLITAEAEALTKAEAAQDLADEQEAIAEIVKEQFSKQLAEKLKAKKAARQAERKATKAK